MRSATRTQVLHDSLPPRPGHFVQTIEPVELLELSPIAEHDRTMATIAKNLGLVAP